MAREGYLTFIKVFNDTVISGSTEIATKYMDLYEQIVGGSNIDELDVNKLNTDEQKGVRKAYLCLAERALKLIVEKKGDSEDIRERLNRLRGLEIKLEKPQ